MKSKSHLIAELLIDATENVLIKGVESWMSKKHPESKLNYKVGSGKKTYHTRTGENSSLIVYGKKMIESKLESRKKCANWRTGREILSRRYFNGELTIQTILCAVVMHESAHYFQNLAGKRARRSVHNSYFYKILDRMHFNGAAKKVYDYLNQHELFRELEFENCDESSIESSTPDFNSKDIKVGDAFYFQTSCGKELIEIAVKVNPKKVKGIDYTVPYPLITKIQPDLSKINPDLLPKKSKFNSNNIKSGDIIFFRNRKGMLIQDTVIKVIPKHVQCRLFGVPYKIIEKVTSF